MYVNQSLEIAFSKSELSWQVKLISISGGNAGNESNESYGKISLIYDIIMNLDGAPSSYGQF
jgi:hypothetical protein